MKEITLSSTIKLLRYDELQQSDRRVAEAARRATEGSYAPYSRFCVGAAALTDGGHLVCGSNQENVAYPSGLCAERVALFAAGAQYPREAVATLAIAARCGGEFTAAPVTPCGACRQVMAECERRHGRPLRLLLCGAELCYLIERATETLLPLSFDAELPE